MIILRLILILKSTTNIEICILKLKWICYFSHVAHFFSAQTSLLLWIISTKICWGEYEGFLLMRFMHIPTRELTSDIPMSYAKILIIICMYAALILTVSWKHSISGRRVLIELLHSIWVSRSRYRHCGVKWIPENHSIRADSRKKE